MAYLTNLIITDTWKRVIYKYVKVDAPVPVAARSKGTYTLVTLPRNVTPYRDSVDGTCDHVTYQKLVTRLRYGLVRCAVGIWPSHQRDGTVTA